MYSREMQEPLLVNTAAVANGGSPSPQSPLSPRLWSPSKWPVSFDSFASDVSCEDGHSEIGIDDRDSCDSAIGGYVQP